MSWDIKKIIRSRRKTIALQVCDDGCLVIKAPLGIQNDIIENVISKHRKWLEKKKKEILSRKHNFTQKKFINEEEFLYLGLPYQLRIIKAKQEENLLILKDGYFYLSERASDPKKIFILWYQREAYREILRRVNWYAKRDGFKYNHVKISNAKTRWGSCSSLGNLNFSWRLIMAPLEVIDYIVIHELVHLIEKNHSRSFWNKVFLLMPDYKSHKKWLNENGYLLNL